MNESEQRRKVSLAGLGLIGAGAVLGLALAGSGPTQNDTSAAPRPATSTPVDPRADPGTPR